VQREREWQSRMTVLDIGSGPYKPVSMFLPKSAKYIPCDLVRRGPERCVLDLNLREDEIGGRNMFGDRPVSLKGARRRIATYPTAITILGVIEYVSDVPYLLRQLRQFNIPVAMTYTAFDPLTNTTIARRSGLGWRTHFTEKEMCDMIEEARFRSWPRCHFFLNVLVPDVN